VKLNKNNDHNQELFKILEEYFLFLTQIRNKFFNLSKLFLTQAFLNEKSFNYIIFNLIKFVKEFNFSDEKKDELLRMLIIYDEVIIRFGLGSYFYIVEFYIINTFNCLVFKQQMDNFRKKTIPFHSTKLFNIIDPYKSQNILNFDQKGYSEQIYQIIEKDLGKFDLYKVLINFEKEKRYMEFYLELLIIKSNLIKNKKTFSSLSIIELEKIDNQLKKFNLDIKIFELIPESFWTEHIYPDKLFLMIEDNLIHDIFNLLDHIIYLDIQHTKKVDNIFKKTA